MISIQRAKNLLTNNSGIPELNRLNHVVYLKDREGFYLGANQLMVELYGLGTKEQVLQQTDHDLIADNGTAYRLIKNDNQCLKSKHAVVFNEYGKLVNIPFNGISVKTPVIFNDNRVGLFGVSLLIENNSLGDLQTFVEIMQNYFNDGLSDLTTHLSQRKAKPSLSKREQQIIQLYCKGFSAPYIGKQLYLSHRTIESHIANVKSKLDVSKKHELIEVCCKLYPEYMD